MNKDFAIVSDSTCDLDTELRRELGVDIVNNYLVVDGKEMPSSIDWGEYYTAQEYYGWIRANRKVSSSQTPPQDFIPFFEAKLKKGLDILYIGCSSAMSNTVNSGKIAANELKDSYPDSKIIVIDALRSSFGLGILVLKAVEMKKEGKSIDEIAAWVEEKKNYVQQVGTVDSLMYLKRAGRVKGFTAIMGTIIGIKPIIIADAKGMNASIDKAKGLRAAFRKCVEYLKKTIVDPEEQYIYISHTDCIEMATEMEKLILQEVKCKGVKFGYVNPSMGYCVGPGMIGVYYFGTKIDFIQD